VPPGSPNLRELRRATADRVAPFELIHSGVEQSDGAGGTVYVGTDRSNSRRRVVSTDLASLSASGQQAEQSTDALRNEWLLVCSAPVQQRRIPSFGYSGSGTIETVAQGFDPALVLGSPTDPCGYVDVERPFSTIVPPNLECEVHVIPPLRGGRSPGLHAHIQHACRVKLREDTLTVQGVVGQTVIDCTASFPWLTNVGQFRDAMYPETITGQQSWAIPGARLRFDGDRALLEPSLSNGAPLPVRVLRPVGTWVAPAATGIWAESTVGLVDDGDQVLGDLDELSLLAAFYVADGETRNSIVGSPEQSFWAAQARAFAARLPGLKDQRTQRAVRQGAPFPDLISVDGPLQGRWGPGFR
jgi:hypothetical protein